MSQCMTVRALPQAGCGLQQLHPSRRRGCCRILSRLFLPQTSGMIGQKRSCTDIGNESYLPATKMGEAKLKSARRLDSWKEIAAFFGRDERTVRRWEKESALPVHRVPGPAKGRVF